MENKELDIFDASFGEKMKHLQLCVEAKLTAEERRALPDSAFALPGRRYPIYDRDHAIAAKARAKEQLDKGYLTKKEYKIICRKADEVLGEKE